MNNLSTHSRTGLGRSCGLLLGSAMLIAAWSSGPTHAATAQAPATEPATGQQSPGAAAAAKAEAEVRRVEPATGRLQLRHGPIANLDMPPMTMVFRVKSPALLEGLKEGDRILFTAEKIDGAYTVTSIEKRP